jgi:hypothetical protein
MRPMDFLGLDGNLEYNTPVGAISDAMNKSIRILSKDGEYEVLSYYLDVDNNFVLDIQKIDAN